MALDGVGPPLITFLSDYGCADEFVGVCHGVIAARCPQARVIDITHAIPPQDVRTGALVLHDALAHMPPAVHLAVVDPTVGSAERRAVALRCRAGRTQTLVGPDNGLLWLAAEGFGGAAAAVDIGRSPERREPVSATFHGRDVFAPVAAALAAGASLEDVGVPLEPKTLQRLELPSAHIEDGLVVAHVLRSDRFGNLTLDAFPEQLERAGLERGAALTVQAGERALPAHHGRTFAEVPPQALLLFADSAGRAALAVNHGSAEQRLGVGRDAELLLRVR
jgi:S-adenosylmethionine hydrolase